MESKTVEPKSIIYIDQAGDCWFVWLNTSNDSHLEHSFNSYEEAAVFAQAWADGITAKDGVECEVMLNMAMSKTPAADIEIDTEELQRLATSIGSFAETLIRFAKAMQAATKIMPDIIDIKRIYLGSTYGYNLLSRLKFLAKYPKLVLLIARVIMWLFMRLPKFMIIRWPMPKLRD